jgi:K+/H+ antiporter YhaU regulatory subunit KhtT
MGKETTPKRQSEPVAIYAKIALDIAYRIANGELAEGTRLSGRSLMSTEYGVSSETIRRSFSLLEEMGVVTVLKNSGVLVNNHEFALSYITRHDTRETTRSRLRRMKELIDKHAAIEKELYETVRLLIDSNERFTASNPFFTYEVEIEKDSTCIGQSLGQLKFWQKTHATVIAIRRDGSIILSPGPDLQLEQSDVLVLVGEQHTRALVENIIH